MHISPAGVDAPVEVVALGEAAAVGGDHVRPDLVDVGRVREVHHVGGVAACGSAVDLESHVVALATETGLVLGETEELHVHEAASEAEALGRRAAEVLVRGDQFSVVRKREALKDLVRGEKTPSFLEVE